MNVWHFLMTNLLVELFMTLNALKIFVQISNNKLPFISDCYDRDGKRSSEYERQ
jgi:hypothetical protein